MMSSATGAKSPPTSIDPAPHRASGVRPREPTPVPSIGPPGGGKGTVLVVDDELALARVYGRALRAEGYCVHAATDGASAEAMFRAGAFDAVVSDVTMPGMDGLQLLRALRRIDDDIPVILATGDPSAERAEQAGADGALMFLVKPVDLRALTQIVDHAVHAHRGGRRARGTGSAPADGRLAARFEAALDKLWMAYQPIVMWATLRPVGFEALVRSDEPSLATPDVLFGAAEQLGRTLDLGRAIRARVATDIPGAPPGARLFVNLHPLDLEDDALYQPGDPLRPHAGRVVLEITERAMLDRIADLDARLERLRSAGFRVAVDDLGAGYSGLSWLARLRPDVVKIDASLVRGIDHRVLQRRIVQSVVTLCRDSDIELIGEGVETEDERQALGFLGCMYHQGFAYARPARGWGHALPVSG